MGQPLPAGYLRTSGTRIVGSDGTPVRLAGVNWYGFDCSAMVAGGLDHQPLDAMCRTIADLGFNHIRLPFCVQMVHQNPAITDLLDRNPSLQGKAALEIMDAIIEAAGSQGLRVVLDSHRADAGWSTQQNGLWYTQEYPESVWLDAWTTLARRYADNPVVIGCDLHNEPGNPPIDPSAWPQNGGSVWGYGGQGADWAAAAERAGNAILGINPNLLIFVEGVRYDPAGPHLGGTRQLYWPGGNLIGVGRRALPQRWRAHPISLDVPDRLVYSVHDYGPDMYSGLAWCQLGTTASTPEACRSVWDETWGYIVRDGLAPVWLGEFGTPNGHKPGDRQPPEDYVRPNAANPQGAWFSYLVQYVADLGVHWCYWPINGTQSPAPGRDPRRPDWYGILAPDWSEVASQPLMDALRTIQ